MSESEKNPLDDLFEMSSSEYGEKYKDHLLDQYKLYVQMADKISDRRSTANNFFLSVNGFLLSIMGILPQLKSGLLNFNLVWLGGVAAIGIIFCIAWMTLIRSYNKLNEAKFTVIGALEKKLPAPVYDVEWKYLTAGKKKKKRFGINVRYFPLTLIESWVPAICIILYIGLIIGWYLIFTGRIKIIQ